MLVHSCLTTSFRDRCAFSQAKRPSIVVTPLSSPFPALPQAKACSSCIPGSIIAFSSPAASLCLMGLGLPVSVASSIYPQPILNLHLSLQLTVLSESCCLPPCSQSVCQLLCPLSTHFTLHLTSFINHGPAPVWQPFHPSSFSLSISHTVGKALSGLLSASVT